MVLPLPACAADHHHPYQPAATVVSHHHLSGEIALEEARYEDEAFEVACQTILAPPDGPAMSDHPPKPLDWRQREAIYKKLEEMGDEEDMREKEDFQKRHGLI